MDVMLMMEEKFLTMMNIIRETLMIRRRKTKKVLKEEEMVKAHQVKVQ